MRIKILKYILDIESVHEEIESIKASAENNFENFRNNSILKRAAERCFEIIGEVINNISKLNPEIAISISGTRNIIGLRNLIIHAYDSIDNELFWGIIQKDIPVLKEEIRKLKL